MKIVTSTPKQNMATSLTPAEMEEFVRKRFADSVNSRKDLHLTIEDLIVEGDRVFCQNVWRWKDRQTGKPMQFLCFVMLRFEGDRIVDEYLD